MDKPPALTQLRDDISTIDEEMLLLLAKRRRLSLDVARSKSQNARPIRDIQREHDLLTRLVKQGQAQGLDSHYVLSLYHTIIEDSVLSQQAFLQGKNLPDNKQYYTIAFLGSRGSYSYQASMRYCERHQLNMQELGCQTFDDIINAVESGHADYGFLPIENTSTGSINEVYDLLQHTNLVIIGETTIDVRHCLLTKPDTELSQIKQIFAHPQPVGQCSRYLQSHKNWKINYCRSSGDAMKQLQDSEANDIAVIGSERGGKLYGLTVLENNLANQQINQTRFIIVARKSIDVPTQLSAKTTLIMATAQKPGSLVDALQILKNHQLNMTKLESRPIPGTPWEEMFYLDIEANLQAPTMQTALASLTKLTRFIKVLGCYPCETVEPTQINQQHLMIEPDTSRLQQDQFVEETIAIKQFILGKAYQQKIAKLTSTAKLISPDAFAQNIKNQGIQAVLLSANIEENERQQIYSSLNKFDLCSIQQVTENMQLTDLAHCDVFLIPAEQMYNQKLFQRVGTQLKPIIVSCHKSADLEIIKQAIKQLKAFGNQQIMLYVSAQNNKILVDKKQELNQLLRSLNTPLIVDQKSIIKINDPIEFNAVVVAIDELGK